MTRHGAADTTPADRQAIEYAPAASVLVIVVFHLITGWRSLKLAG